MARKNVALPFKTFDAQSLATNATSAITDVSYLDNVGIILNWTGTALSGQITVEVANPQIDAKEADYVWTTLDFGSNIIISGASGTHLLTINQLPFTKIRLQYASNAGTGNLTASVAIKQVGG